MYRDIRAVTDSFPKEALIYTAVMVFFLTVPPAVFFSYGVERNSVLLIFAGVNSAIIGVFMLLWVMVDENIFYLFPEEQAAEMGKAQGDTL